MERNDEFGRHFIDSARAVAQDREPSAVTSWLQNGEALLLNEPNVVLVLDDVDFEQSVSSLYEKLSYHADYEIVAARWCCKVWLAISMLKSSFIADNISNALDAMKMVGSRTESLERYFTQSETDQRAEVRQAQAAASARARHRRNAGVISWRDDQYERIIAELRDQYPEERGTVISSRVATRFNATRTEQLRTLNQEHSASVRPLQASSIRTTFGL